MDYVVVFENFECGSHPPLCEQQKILHTINTLVAPSIMLASRSHDLDCITSSTFCANDANCAEIVVRESTSNTLETFFSLVL